jgi:hypothetical protein
MDTDSTSKEARHLLAKEVTRLEEAVNLFQVSNLYLLALFNQRLRCAVDRWLKNQMVLLYTSLETHLILTSLSLSLSHLPFSPLESIYITMYPVPFSLIFHTRTYMPRFLLFAVICGCLYLKRVAIRGYPPPWLS